MPDKYQKLRDAVTEMTRPAGESFPKYMEMLAELLKERDHLADECHEQARLLGMGGSRELALRTALQGLLDVLPVCPKNTGIEGVEEKYRNAVTAARGVLAGCRKQIGREEQ